MQALRQKREQLAREAHHYRMQLGNTDTSKRLRETKANQPLGGFQLSPQAPAEETTLLSSSPARGGGESCTRIGFALQTALRCATRRSDVIRSLILSDRGP
jgi:hypothetical protein